MNKAFILKIIGMLGLILLMSIAVSYVNHIILERMRNQQHVQRDIAKSYTRAQTLIGPILVVPYTEEYPEKTIKYIDGKSVEATVQRYRKSTAYFLPEQLALTGAFDYEHKKRGIYKALMYKLDGAINGQFRIPANYGVYPSHAQGQIKFHKPFISFGMSDTRGINGNPKLTFNKQKYKLIQGSHIDKMGNGIHATIKQLHASTELTHQFQLDVDLKGMENFHFRPVAEHNKIILSSTWPHPNFFGSFLPSKSQITEQGFKGEWSISSLSSNSQSKLKQALNLDTPWPKLEALSIGFIEPINVYSQSDRATKYGLLFIGLTFVGFFIFEILKQLRIHPAQYTLVGLSMAMFYLLLVSFAEQLGFAHAYLIASASCVLLLGYYLSYVLKSKTHAITFASLLSALYGALYVILASEDNALIMGSLLVFGLLAATMVITRKVDWYAINMQKA